MQAGVGHAQRHPGQVQFAPGGQLAGLDAVDVQRRFAGQGEAAHRQGFDAHAQGQRQAVRQLEGRRVRFRRLAGGQRQGDPLGAQCPDHQPAAEQLAGGQFQVQVAQRHFQGLFGVALTVVERAHVDTGEQVAAPVLDAQFAGQIRPGPVQQPEIAGAGAEQRQQGADQQQRDQQQADQQSALHRSGPMLRCSRHSRPSSTPRAKSTRIGPSGERQRTPKPALRRIS